VLERAGESAGEKAEEVREGDSRRKCVRESGRECVREGGRSEREGEQEEMC